MGNFIFHSFMMNLDDAYYTLETVFYCPAICLLPEGYTCILNPQAIQGCFTCRRSHFVSEFRRFWDHKHTFMWAEKGALVNQVIQINPCGFIRKKIETYMRIIMEHGLLVINRELINIHTS